MKLPSLPKVNFSQKKILWGLIALAIALTAYTYAIEPLVEAKRRADQEMAIQRRLLLRYSEILQDRKNVEEALEKTQKVHGEILNRLLAGETPQLGAAVLQDIVKRLAEKCNLNIRSFRNLDAKEVGPFRRISVQIDFNPMSNMQNLTQFLYEIENQEKDLMISEMDLLVFNPRMANAIQGSLIVSGLMKGTKGKEKEKEKEKEKGRGRGK